MIGPLDHLLVPDLADALKGVPHESRQYVTQQIMTAARSLALRGAEPPFSVEITDLERATFRLSWERAESDTVPGPGAWMEAALPLGAKALPGEGRNP